MNFQHFCPDTRAPLYLPKSPNEFKTSKPHTSPIGKLSRNPSVVESMVWPLDSPSKSFTPPTASRKCSRTFKGLSENAASRLASESAESRLDGSNKLDSPSTDPNLSLYNAREAPPLQQRVVKYNQTRTDFDIENAPTSATQAIARSLHLFARSSRTLNDPNASKHRADQKSPKKEKRKTSAAASPRKSSARNRPVTFSKLHPSLKVPWNIFLNNFHRRRKRIRISSWHQIDGTSPMRAYPRSSYAICMKR